MAERRDDREREITEEIKAPHRDAGEKIREYLLESKEHEEQEEKELPKTKMKKDEAA